MIDTTARKARWRLLRAFVFALVAVCIGVIGHAAAESCSPEPLVLLIGVPLVTAYAWLFAGRRRGLMWCIVSVAVIQVLAHAASSVMSTGHHATEPASMPGMDHGMHAEMATAAAASGSGSMTSMLVVHVVASLFGLLVLARLERVAWRVARSAAGIIGAVLAPRRYEGTRTRAIGSITLPLTSVLAGMRSGFEFEHACGMRGPPAVAA